MLGRVDVALEEFAHPADRRGLVWNLQHFHELRELIGHTPNAEHRKLAEKGLPALRSIRRPGAGRARDASDPR